MGKFSNIKVIIWDFDNTLYKSIPALSDDIRRAELRTIQIHTGWSGNKALEEFEKLYTKVFASATDTVAHIAHIPFAQAAVEMEEFYDRGKYLSYDSKLTQLFNSLKNFRHYILTNGIKSKVIESLNILGLDPKIFEEIVTIEVCSFHKPDTRVFEYILAKTKFSLEEHLMVGDKIGVDIEPAKKLGLKTCLVWSKNPTDIADITLPTVYDIPQVIL